MIRSCRVRSFLAGMSAQARGYPGRRRVGLLTANGKSGTLSQLRQPRAEVSERKIAQFQGRIVGSAGDSLLVEFASAVGAVQCAVDIQAGLDEWNANLPEDRRMTFRMGVNLGDVIPGDGTIHGEGVNVAARLEKLAE